jgi:hypothetical protein
MGLKLSKEYLWKEIGDQVVVLHFESGRYFSLNASGSCIWKSLLENQTSDEIAAGLCAAFEVDEKTAREDLLVMTENFLQKKFLIAD